MHLGKKHRRKLLQSPTSTLSLQDITWAIMIKEIFVDVVDVAVVVVVVVVVASSLKRHLSGKHTVYAIPEPAK